MLLDLSMKLENQQHLTPMVYCSACVFWILLVISAHSQQRYDSLILIKKTRVCVSIWI